MTEKQRQFIEPLTAKQAGLYYTTLMRERGFARAQEFWRAYKKIHPDLGGGEIDTVTVTQTAQNAWDGVKYNRVIVDTPQQEIRLDTATQSYFEWQVKEPKIKAIFNLLSDMREHSRQELLDMFKEKGWEKDIEFRKHISEIRKYLVACRSPYYIPKNKNGSGYGVYQLKPKGNE